MCVLSITVPIQKKSENLFNDPRTFMSPFFFFVFFFFSYVAILIVEKVSHIYTGTLNHTYGRPQGNWSFGYVLCFISEEH